MVQDAVRRTAGTPAIAPLLQRPATRLPLARPAPAGPPTPCPKAPLRICYTPRGGAGTVTVHLASFAELDSLLERFGA